MRSEPRAALRRSLAALLLVTTLASGAIAREGRGRPEGGPGVRSGSGDVPGGAPGGTRGGYANPSAVIAAEYAFARDAAQRGQWTAFAAAAAPDAVMFTPKMVWAQVWLRGRANPAAGLSWQPTELWSSCDGSLVVSHGAWQSGEGKAARSGWFTTLWQRQPDGAYKWVLDHGGDGASPTAPDMIAAHVADCPPRARRTGESDPHDRKRGRGKRPKPPKPIAIKDLPPLDPAGRSGAAKDGSLRWSVTVDADDARTLSVTWTKDGRQETVLTDRVPAPRRAD